MIRRCGQSGRRDRVGEAPRWREGGCDRLLCEAETCFERRRRRYQRLVRVGAFSFSLISATCGGGRHSRGVVQCRHLRLEEQRRSQAFRLHVPNLISSRNTWEYAKACIMQRTPTLASIALTSTFSLQSCSVTFFIPCLVAKCRAVCFFSSVVHSTFAPCLRSFTTATSRPQVGVRVTW